MSHNDKPTDDAMSDAVSAKALPTSHGVFKPVGHVMVGAPQPAQTQALIQVLHDAGWTHEAVLHFEPGDVIDTLKHMVDDAGPLSGFGSEISLLRRFIALSEEGYRWLLVKADDLETAQAVGRMASEQGATQAVYYRTLTVEELI